MSTAVAERPMRATMKAKAPVNTFQSGQTLDNSASDKLREECVGCRLRIQRMSMTKGFDEAAKNKIAAALGMEQKKRTISGGHKIYDDGHPAIKIHNDFFNRVEKYWKGMTLPLSSVYSEESVTEGGTRLIRRDHAEDFQSRMTAFRAEAETVEKKLNEDRSDILDKARELLGDRYDYRNYPDSFSIGVHWGFPNVDVPAYLAQMAPAAYEHERQLVASRFEQTWELATVKMLEEFHAVVDTWVQSLGPSIRINPPQSHELFRLQNAEIVSRVMTKEDAAVPVDQFKLIVRYKVTGQGGFHQETVGPFTEEQYSALMPLQSDKPRTFRISTVENLIDMVNKFRRLGPTISANSDFTKTVEEIEAQIGRMGGNPGDVADELRNSRMVRDSTHALMTNLSHRLGNEITMLGSRKRRMVTHLPD